MPSIVLNNQSGGQPIFSGQVLGSGYRFVPQGGVQLVLSRAASGACYVGLSGNLTVGSGSMSGVGSGNMDGLELAPGGAYFIPRGALSNASGAPPNVYVATDASCSGQARLSYEVL